VQIEKDPWRSAKNGTSKSAPQERPALQDALELGRPEPNRAWPLAAQLRRGALYESAPHARNSDYSAGVRTIISALKVQRSEANSKSFDRSTGMNSASVTTTNGFSTSSM
jgi:hypothetical protein